MSIKNPSLKVFLQKNFPTALCGYKFYDKFLDRILDVSPHNAWEVFSQVFVDAFINKGTSKKWTGVPYLNPMDCPCSPGSVILVRERNLRNYFRGVQNHAYVAGLVTDFFPPELRNGPALVPVEEDTADDYNRVSRPKQFRKVFQSKNTEAAVVITATGTTVYSVDNQLNKETTLLDLDNFGPTKTSLYSIVKEDGVRGQIRFGKKENTGFKSTSCYVVTRVLTVDSLKIEVTLNGDVFYEHTFTAGVPIGFQASKIQLLPDGCGLLKNMRPIKKKLPITIMRRRTIQHFLNAFTPNQAKLGKAVGDAPAVFNWREPNALRSYRPNFLPRPERSHQTDLIYYYKTDDELIELIYGKQFCQSLNSTADSHNRNRPRDSRPEVVLEAEVHNQPFDEIYDVESEDNSTVTTTSKSLESGVTSEDSGSSDLSDTSEETSEEIDEDTSDDSSSYTGSSEDSEAVPE